MSIYWTIFGKLVVWSEHVNPGSRSHEQAAIFMFSLSLMALLGGTANLAIYFLDIGTVDKTVYQVAMLVVGGLVLVLNWSVAKNGNKLKTVVERLKSEERISSAIKNVLVAIYVVASFVYAFVIPLFLM